MRQGPNGVKGGAGRKAWGWSSRGHWQGNTNGGAVVRSSVLIMLLGVGWLGSVFGFIVVSMSVHVPSFQICARLGRGGGSRCSCFGDTSHFMDLLRTYTLLLIMAVPYLASALSRYHLGSETTQRAPT